LATQKHILFTTVFCYVALSNISDKSRLHCMQLYMSCVNAGEKIKWRSDISAHVYFYFASNYIFALSAMNNYLCRKLWLHHFDCSEKLFLNIKCPKLFMWIIKQDTWLIPLHIILILSYPSILWCCDIFRHIYARCLLHYVVFCIWCLICFSPSKFSDW
jgi:hypothetical protein